MRFKICKFDEGIVVDPLPQENILIFLKRVPTGHSTSNILETYFVTCFAGCVFIFIFSGFYKEGVKKSI